MIKKVVLSTSGIKNKQVVEHEKINDFQTYLLKDQYSYSGNRSTVVFDYVEKLLDKVSEKVS